MKNLIKWTVVVVLSQLLLFSCFAPKDKSFTHLPFRQSENGLWGMISSDGKILVSDEYKFPPFSATEGVYIVRKDNGMYEYYKADEKPVRIGSQYYKAAAFRESLAPVMEDEETISVINLQGEVVFKLSKVSGKKIVSCSFFSDGLALIEDEDGLKGFVNKKGDVAIDLQYSEAFQFNEGFAVVKTDESDRSEWIIINTKGEVINELNAQTIETTGIVSLGLLGILKSNNDGAWSFISTKGDEIIKPSREFATVSVPIFKTFTYFDGTKWGVSDITGKRVIPAEYDNIENSGNGFFIAKKGDVWYVVDSKNRETSQADFTSHTGNNGGYIFAKVRDKYILLNSKGERIGDDEYLEVLLNMPPLSVEVELQNYKKTVINLFQSVAPGKLWKLSIGTTVSQVSELLGSGSAESLKSSRTLTTTRNGSGIESSITMGFNSEMGVAVTERKMLRDMWGRAYWDNVIQGYVFNENSYLQEISANIKLFGELSEKEKEVAAAIVEIAKSSGFTIQKEAEGSISLSAAGGRSLSLNYSKKSGLNLLMK